MFQLQSRFGAMVTSLSLSVRLSVASTELESRRRLIVVIYEVFARTQAGGIGQAGAVSPADGQRQGKIIYKDVIDDTISFYNLREI